MTRVSSIKYSLLRRTKYCSHLLERESREISSKSIYLVSAEQETVTIILRVACSSTIVVIVNSQLRVRSKESNNITVTVAVPVAVAVHSVMVRA